MPRNRTMAFAWIKLTLIFDCLVDVNQTKGLLLNFDQFRLMSATKTRRNHWISLVLFLFFWCFVCVEQKYVSLSNGRSKLFVGLCANQSRRSGRKKKYFELKWKRFAGFFRRYIPYLNYKFDHKVTNQSLEQQFFVRNFMLWMFSVTFFCLFLLVSLLGDIFFHHMHTPHHKMRSTKCNLIIISSRFVISKMIFFFPQWFGLFFLFQMTYTHTNFEHENTIYRICLTIPASSSSFPVDSLVFSLSLRFFLYYAVARPLFFLPLFCCCCIKLQIIRCFFYSIPNFSLLSG